MYRVQLDEAARQELIRRAHQPKIAPKTRDRLEMLRLSDAGFSIPKIARHLQSHEQTVRHWIKVFLLEGFDALDDAPRPGRPSGITEAIRWAVRQWIEAGDRIWSAGQIAEKVEEDYGIRRSEKQWRRLLRQEQLSYKRTSRNLKHKQNPQHLASKKEALEVLEKRGPPERSTCVISTKPVLP